MKKNLLLLFSLPLLLSVSACGKKEDVEIQNPEITEETIIETSDETTNETSETEISNTEASGTENFSSDDIIIVEENTENDKAFTPPYDPELEDTSPQIEYQTVDEQSQNEIYALFQETNQWKSYSFSEYYIPIEQFHFLESNGYYEGTYSDDKIYVYLGYEEGSSDCVINVSNAKNLSETYEMYNQMTENY